MADRHREGEQKQNAQETKTQRERKESKRASEAGGFGCTDRGLCVGQRGLTGGSKCSMWQREREGERLCNSDEYDFM